MLALVCAAATVTVVTAAPLSAPSSLAASLDNFDVVLPRNHMGDLERFHRREAVHRGIELSMPSAGVKFTLDLTRYSLFAPGFRMVVDEQEMTPEQAGLEDCYYHVSTAHGSPLRALLAVMRPLTT